MGEVFRRFAVGDAPALEALLARARGAGDLRAASDPHAEFTVRLARSQPGSVGLALDGGALVGVVLPEVKAIVVEPGHRRRGIGRRLVAEGLAIERERGRAALIMGALPDDAVATGFLGATGFTYHSTLWDLEIAADLPVPGPAWPAGLAARAFDRTRDIEAWADLFNAAFADHATPLQLDPADLAAAIAENLYEDADTLVVEAGDGLVGFCSTSPRRREGVVDERAEIWSLGVRPDLQGRGLGRQLLRWGVRRLRSIGARAVWLSVNGRNAGALRLYESEGFVRTATRDRWAHPVTPRPATQGGEGA